MWSMYNILTSTTVESNMSLKSLHAFLCGVGQEAQS
jgi:hypothetical protein